MVQVALLRPNLDPAEGAWANMKNGLGNLAASNADQLAAMTSSGPAASASSTARPHRRFLAQTGLTLNPDRRRPQMLAFQAL